MSHMRSVECGPNKRQRYTVSETPAGTAWFSHIGWTFFQDFQDFFRFKSAFPANTVNLLEENFDLCCSETISSNKRDIHLFAMVFDSDEQRKAATLKHTFIETVFVVFPIHWIPSNLVTVSSILSFWMAAPSNRPLTMFLLANCLDTTN